LDDWKSVDPQERGNAADDSLIEKHIVPEDVIYSNQAESSDAATGNCLKEAQISVGLSSPKANREQLQSMTPDGASTTFSPEVIPQPNTGTDDQ
jgi:hypothetical protein